MRAGESLLLRLYPSSEDDIAPTVALSLEESRGFERRPSDGLDIEIIKLHRHVGQSERVVDRSREFRGDIRGCLWRSNHGEPSGGDISWKDFGQCRHVGQVSHASLAPDTKHLHVAAFDLR